MTLFALLLVDFLRRSRRVTVLSRPRARVVVAVCLSVTTIYIRSSYQTIEVARGWKGCLIIRERYFIALDAAMRIIAVGVYNLVDSIVLLPKRSNDNDTSGPVMEHSVQMSWKSNGKSLCTYRKEE